MPKMNFLWQTAISIIDIGSSLIYHLLGRDLNDDEIRLVEELFLFMSRPAPPISLYIHELQAKNNLCNQMADLELNATSNKTKKSNYSRSRSNSSTAPLGEQQLNFLKELELERIEFEAQSSKLVELIKQLPKGKDILLLTNKRNGYNLLQLCMIHSIDYTYTLLNNYKKCLNSGELSNSDIEAIELNYDLIMSAKTSLISLMFEYGCDPNRGLVLSNRSKFVINIDSMLKLSLNEKPADSACSKRKEKFMSNDELNEMDEKASFADDATTVRLLSGKASTPSLPQTQSAAHLSPSSTSSAFMVNTDLSFITESIDNDTLNSLSVTPIDSPLLLICCLFNCHNLIALNKSSKKTKSRQMSKTSSLSKNKLTSPVNNTKRSMANRRHTIQFASSEMSALRPDKLKSSSSTYNLNC